MRATLIVIAFGLGLGLGLGVAGCGFQPGAGATDAADPTDAGIELDACIPTAETCEGTDQDCDGLIDEGFTVGAPCDGPDTDTCADDMTICNASGTEVCGDTSGDDDVELCNGVDDDCDGAIDNGLGIGDQCDGPDGDVCREGTLACDSSTMAAVCSDVTGTTVEVCNGANDDCDTLTDEGFDLTTDEANCGECDNTCTNSLGTTLCLVSACVPTCSVGAAQCDGEPDNGCELQDTDPTCNPIGTSLVTVDGDAADTETLTGNTERFMRVRIRESDSGNDIALTARIALISGAGTNYDLYVYCPGCQTPPLSDSDDIVEVGRADGNGDRGYDVFIEVRYNPSPPSTTCATWTVTITGGVATNTRCGGP